MAEEHLRYFVRIANTDLDGNKQLLYALRRIKGVGTVFANAICRIAGINAQIKIGALQESDIKKVNDILANPAGYSLPVWLFNRRKDPETGVDRHIVTTDLQFALENDLKSMKKMKCYKGVRHIAGLPVRGQRTRSNFRKNKGKVHLGVQKKDSSKKGRV